MHLLESDDYFKRSMDLMRNVRRDLRKRFVNAFTPVRVPNLQYANDGNVIVFHIIYVTKSLIYIQFCICNCDCHDCFWIPSQICLHVFALGPMDVGLLLHSIFHSVEVYF